MNAVPRLRFPEFNGEWRKKKMGDFADVSKLAGYEFTKHIVYTDEGEFIGLRGLNIKNEGLDLTDVKYVDKSDLAKLSRSKLYKGDLMFTYVGTVGEVALISMNDRYYLAPNVSRIRADTQWALPEFILQYFLNDTFKKKEVEIRIATSSQPALSMASIRQFTLSLPPLNEQRKITDFLVAVDQKIASIDKKIELLKQYKKAVMQKIFTQQLRFKNEDGNNYPDWSTKKVADIYSFIRTNSASREMLWSGDGIKNIHYGDIHTKIPARLDVTNYDLPAFKDRLVTFAEHDYCQPRDVLMADASEDYKDIGKCIEIIKVGERKVVGGLHTLLLRPSVEIAVGFGGYLFKSDSVRKQIQRAATGVSVLGISKANVAEIGILIPTHEEQRKISEYLGSLDDHISANLRRLEDLRQFKRALLQRMFA